LLKINDGVVPASVLRAVFREIWSGAVALQEPVKVAFLGPLATFTHQAALATFGSAVTYVDQPTIADVFDAVSRREATYGVVPVENSTEGSVTHTLDMFADTDLNIYAELNLPIHHSLLSNCKPADITTVYSHPQVFGQCRRWLHRNLPRAKLVEVASTTEAAGRCSREANTGALASALAAQQYNVPIQESNIEDASENTTRFFVLSKKKPEASGDDKTSLLLAIRHRVGALYESLLPFGKHGVNLTFIESRPSKRRSWEYFFFIDFVGHVSDPHVQQVLNDLAETCQFVKILGSYPRAPESEG
ncbi:MAG: prephenate dehydratase, partial [Candidatus Pacebacteria bacterium]|nr:prephenate dehydratase [Candidatus Paceibacterota bacterium]